MKRVLQKSAIITIIFSVFFTFQKANAQTVCGAGYTKAGINWDFQYYKLTDLPTSPLKYMFGKNNMRLAWGTTTGTNALIGVPTTNEHTGSTGSFGNGTDLKFRVGNGVDTLVFEDEVTNLNFSIYDLDSTQALNVSAYNALNMLQTVTLARVAGTTLSATVTSTNPTITATNARVAYSSNTATVNVTVAGPVNRVILRFTKAGPAACYDTIFISDIAACNNNTTTGTWAANYQSINTPETGQPSFVVASYKDSIMVVDLTNNTSELLYQDPAFSASGINSLAIDPYNQYIYYTDNVRNISNTAIYRYDVKKGIKTTWIADVRTYGIKLYTSTGMGSAGASFYDGSLFIGQDASASSDPISVYKIDIDANGNPVDAYRFWSKWGNNGSALYDWSDFVVNEGVCYNFNNARLVSNRTSMLHFDLNTMDSLRGFSDTARAQLSVDYAGNIWHMLSGKRQLYNTTTGTFGAAINYTGTGTSAVLDAGESFKYPYDFGDAPVSYGVPFHLFKVSPNLRMGDSVDYEVRDTTNALASADDIYNTGVYDDEDGVASFSTLSVANASYTVTVNVSNSTGADATLYGFLDFNRDGDFADAGETSAATTVANGATTADVTWTGLTGGSVGSSFIRFRLASNATEASNYSGYAATGESEDYPIPIIASSLPVELITFKGELKEKNTTLLSWATASELNNDYFDVQRKKQDGTGWENIGKVDGFGNSQQLISYNFTDENPQTGENYYRLNQVDYDGRSEYSNTIMIKLETPTAQGNDEAFVVYPNPVRNEVWIKSEENITRENEMTLDVFNISGERLYSSVMEENTHRIDLSEYQNGMYLVKIGTKTYRIIKE